MLTNLYGGVQSPYYIYAPRWIESSAGIRALHFLCHSLNRSGQIAYLVMCEPTFNNLPRVSPNLLTPILTQEVADSHYHANLTPIVIYSETVPGNPLGATFIVRYLMNYVGALDGPTTYEENDYLLAFSQTIALDVKDRIRREVNSTLFLPPIDPRGFVVNTVKENYQVVYAGKYRSFIGKPSKVGALRSIEIFRDGPRMQDKNKVKNLLSKASVLYTFENSSIATEAILSGTPVCFVQTQLTQKIIAEFELGSFGVTLSDDADSIKKARSTIPDAIAVYFKSIETYFLELEKLIASTQLIAGETGYSEIIQVPTFNSYVTEHRIALAGQIFRKRGLGALIRVIYHFAMRRLSWRFWNKSRTKINSDIVDS